MCCIVSGARRARDLANTATRAAETTGGYNTSCTVQHYSNPDASKLENHARCMRPDERCCIRVSYCLCRGVSLSRSFRPTRGKYADFPERRALVLVTSSPASAIIAAHAAILRNKEGAWEAYTQMAEKMVGGVKAAHQEGRIEISPEDIKILQNLLQGSRIMDEGSSGRFHS